MAGVLFLICPYTLREDAIETHLGAPCAPYARRRCAVTTRARHERSALRWRHNGRDIVSNHQPHDDCLLNRLFTRRSKKHQSFASLAFVRGIHRGPVNSPHKWPVTRKMSPFDDVIMVTTQSVAGQNSGERSHGGAPWALLGNATIALGAPWHLHGMENVKLFAIFSHIFVRSHGALRNFKSPC